MKTAAVRDIQKNSRPLVSFQGERRLVGTTREARRGEQERQVDGRNVFSRDFHKTNRSGGQGHEAVQ